MSHVDNQLRVAVHFSWVSMFCLIDGGPDPGPYSMMSICFLTSLQLNESLHGFCTQMDPLCVI